MTKTSIISFTAFAIILSRQSHAFTLFQPLQHNSISSTLSRSHALRSPINHPQKRPLLLPMVSLSQETENNSQVLKDGEKTILRLEKEMQKHEKFRENLLNKLKEANAAIGALEAKKREYLEGMEIGVLPEAQKFTETTVRSAVKAAMWRVIAGSVTFVTALRFSGNLGQALGIVGSDFFSKSFTMFLGERIMNKSQAGRKGGADDVGRSLMKALIWRLFAIANTLTVAAFVAKDLTIASKIAGSDAIVKTALMFVYERVWAKVEWGKEYVIEFSI